MTVYVLGLEDTQQPADSGPRQDSEPFFPNRPEARSLRRHEPQAVHAPIERYPLDRLAHIGHRTLVPDVLPASFFEASRA